MAYRYFFKDSAQRLFEKLDRNLQARMAAKIRLLADTPRPAGCTKLAGHADLYRIRVGDYRVVYRIDAAAELIEITIVAHRREVYRGL